MKIRVSILFLLFLTLAIFGYSFIQKDLEKNGFDLKTSIALIQEKTNKELQLIDNEQAEIKNIILNNENNVALFSELKPINSIYIYQDDKIIFWNDYKYYPTQSKTTQSKSILFSGDENGKRLIISQVFKTQNHKYKLTTILKLSEHIIVEKNNSIQLNNKIFDGYILNVSSNKNTKLSIKDSNGSFIFGINNIKTTTKSNIIYLLFFLLISIVGFVFFYIKYIEIADVKTKFLAIIYIFINVLIGYYFLIFNTKSIEILYLYSYIILLIINTNIILNLFYKKNYNINIKIKNTYLEIFLYHVVFIAVTYIFFKTIVSIYNNPDCNYVVTNFLIFNATTYFSIALSICYSILYFFIIHFVIHKLVMQSIQNDIVYNKLIVLGLLIFTSLFLTIGTGVGWIYVAICAAIYFYIIYTSKLSITLKKIRYITYFYFFIFILFVSIIICCSINKVEFAKRATMSKVLATKVSRSQPSLDVMYISKGIDSCAKDSLTLQILTDTIQNRTDIETQLIKNNFLNLSERYETKFYFFNKLGNSVSEQSSKNFFSIQKKLNKPSLFTKFKYVYKFDGDLQGYFAWRSIKDSTSNIIGYLLMEFRLRKLIPNSIYPELFTKIKSNYDYNYSYSLYIKNNLTSVYNQKTSSVPFQKINEELISLYQNGKTENQRYMRLSKTNDNEYVMIGIDAFGWISFYSNFSFIFIVFTFILAVFILFNTLYFKYKQVSNTLSTKIQLFIHLSFFVPFLSISISLFFIINFLYQNDISDSYQQKTMALKEQLYTTLEKSELENLQHKLSEVSTFAKADLNIYQPNGELLATTQPSVFENEFIGNIINPEAFKSIQNNAELSYILDENIGDFHFKTVYHAINSYKTGQILAILAVPFFESNDKSNGKITFVLTSILNIFSLIFILFMAITFFISRYLTIPLTMLTNSLKNVSLELQNNPLEYGGDDEIGLLVKEYNNMLIKLTESKKILASNEKESAWREMAKQVAHEIKNPLTPIKLTLQNIQRLLKQDRNDKIEIVEKSTISILEQVDTLTEIANSFSAFTQMPTLKRDVFNLDDMIQNITQLYAFENDIIITFNKTENIDYKITSDEKLLNRILLNLILNAIESKDYTRNLKIEITLSYQSESIILIAIKDNGVGIEKENYEKVFQPNFSTKNSGSGIGLAICKRGIEQIGGKIKFESEIRIGTTFWIELPKNN